MDLRSLPLSELRSRARERRHPSAQGRLAAALRRDGRAGARALAEAIEKRLAGERRERRRVAELFARRGRLAAEGFRAVAGVDEVGVGPLAGPVVAAAVILGDAPDLPGLDDSKKLDRATRERLAGAIRVQARAWCVGVVAPAQVDRLNIYRAALEAMRRAVTGLGIEPDHLLVDARSVPGVSMAQTPIVGGDAEDGSIAAASILAKVYRDELMRRLDRTYPGYGFARHKGYGTREHLDALRRLGPCEIHRRSFAPVAQHSLF